MAQSQHRELFIQVKTANDEFVYGMRNRHIGFTQAGVSHYLRQGNDE